MSQEKNKSDLETPKLSQSLYFKIISGLLFVHFLFILHTSYRMTVTHDEYWHLPVGHLNLTTGQFHYDNLNPPLLRMWAAIPLLFSETNPVSINAETDETGHGDVFSKANPKNYHSLFFRGRIMIGLLSVGTGLLIGIWASKWFGMKAGLLSVLIWTFGPNVTGHASIVTTDLGAAFFFIASALMMISYSEKLNWSRAIYSGVLLGLSQLAKYTCVILYPIGFVIFVLVSFKNYETLKNKWKMILLQGLGVIVTSILVINLGYLFNGSFKSLNDYEFQSSSLKSISQKVSFISIVPFPEDYVKGIDRQRAVMEKQHPVYLDGEWSLKGFPHYYLMTLVYKIPHAVQGLFFFTLISLFRKSAEKKNWIHQLLLLVPFLILFFIASHSGMQLGLRYLLPVYPFLVVWISQSAELIDLKKNIVVTAIFVLCLVGIPFSFRNHPYHISYFNEWAGGAAGGRYHLLDSNLDWGQDLRELRAWLDENPIDNLKLAYFGMLFPAELGIEYTEPSRRVPKPGWYAISVNFVQGRPHRLRDMFGKGHILGIDELGYFRYFEPKKIIGTSIYLYHLTSDDVLEWYKAVRQNHGL